MDAIFHEALARPPGDRSAFLDCACGGDADLRGEVESLLAFEPQVEGFMATPDVDVPGEEPATPAGTDAAEPARIGTYRIDRRLGEGGMGVVYLAVDERLGRRVALKVLRRDSTDPYAASRLVREARVAAGVTHPLICQVFELGEWQGRPFIAMELAEGESLATMLSRGALPAAEAIRLALSIGEALGVLHAHGIVHRDLKPSNIFVTGAAVKLLDFGLARPLAMADGETLAVVTQAGAFVGTPQYAAPEQLTGGVVDARADLFSLGVVLFEMLTGRPPFAGRTIAAVLHAVVYETPPALTGSSAMTAIDRVVHRALAKQPEHRYASAAALVGDLSSVLPLVRQGDVAAARPILRLAVLPFRLLNPDHEVDYLGLSFADALVTALSGLESLVVRSSLRSARFATPGTDLAAVAVELAVDVVLTGSILRQGDRLRIAAELVSVPAGDVCWTHAAQAPLGAVFDLHETLARGVVQALPLAPADRARPAQPRPANSKAFDLYLRGMQLRMESSSWRQARAFFAQSVELDPSFAPAWAERGRLDRILGKFEAASHYADAEAAFRRALALDPDNGAAQHYFAQLEIDLGRAGDALVRLVDRAGRRRAEPQIFAAIVHAARYAGLLDASLAAHEQARLLDPTIATSVLHTYYMQGDYTRALDESHRSSDPFEPRVLAALGRDAEAMAAARREEERFAAVTLLRGFSTGLRAALEGRTGEAVAALQPFDGPAVTDGEALFYVAEIYARLGLPDRARAFLDRAVDGGFLCVTAFNVDPYFATLRQQAWWPSLIDRVQAGHVAAQAAFIRAGGPAVLGLV